MARSISKISSMRRTASAAIFAEMPVERKQRHVTRVVRELQLGHEVEREIQILVTATIDIRGRIGRGTDPRAQHPAATEPAHLRGRLIYKLKRYFCRISRGRADARDQPKRLGGREENRGEKSSCGHPAITKVNN